MRSIEEFELEGKKVFLRLDLNVPIKDGVIQDDTRLEAALPTIRYAIEKGAKLVVASHLGRPKGKPVPEMSLEPVAEELGKRLGVEVTFIESPDSDAPKALLKTMPNGSVVMLENLRFTAEETQNSEDFAKRLASYTDIYINDAFGACHRAHASISALAELVKDKGCGFLIKKELDVLDKLLNSAESPFVAVLGGAKVSDKIPVIDNLVDRVDTFLIGGAMAYTFLAAKGFEVGKSLVETGRVKYAKDLIERVELRNKKILLPLDHVVTTSIEKVSAMKNTQNEGIDSDYLGVDIGPKTRTLFAAEIMKAKTVFWNGPMGVFETSEFADGTFALSNAVAESEAFSVIGGGDSAAAIQKSGRADKVSHISTGGGASLEYLQGDTLPGLAVLEK
jgi:phosphoglycerate kinase